MNQENSTSPPSPDYTLPPVIEVVCGVQFPALSALAAPLVGLFWNRIRDEYPKTSPMPQLRSETETFSKKESSGVRLEVHHAPPLARTFFFHKSDNWVLQLQNDRFLHNWRKTKDSDEYPRFPTVFDKFREAWSLFQKFCSEEELLEEPAVNQLELTYINHIPAGSGWQTLGEIGDVFPNLTWGDEHDFLPAPESLSWDAAFLLPDQLGRLRISVKHVIRRADDRPVLLCELTARGMPKTADNDAVEKWFRLGHEWIVRGFADLASKQIQEQVWKRFA